MTVEFPNAAVDRLMYPPRYLAPLHEHWGSAGAWPGPDLIKRMHRAMINRQPGWPLWIRLRRSDHICS